MAHVRPEVCLHRTIGRHVAAGEGCLARSVGAAATVQCARMDGAQAEEAASACC